MFEETLDPLGDPHPVVLVDEQHLDGITALAVARGEVGPVVRARTGRASQHQRLPCRTVDDAVSDERQVRRAGRRRLEP